MSEPPPADDSESLELDATFIVDGDDIVQRDDVVTPDLPDRIGDYVIEDEIARGGMGVVYKARHEQLNRIVALKMILTGRFSSTDSVKRFRMEAEAAAKLDHSGIIPVYDFGEFEGNHFLSMRLIEGGSMADLLREKSGLRDLLEVLVQVSNAVHHAHQRGILHRDLKPANVLIDAESNNAVLTDLGLAREVEGESNLTATGVVVGTPSYMSPEQAQGQEVTTAADIYSLGASLYEILTGQPPHREENAVATLMKVINEPPVAPSTLAPDVDRNLEAVCLKCLHHDPDHRYASAKSLADDLTNWLEDRPLSVKPPSMGTVLRIWIKQNLRSAIGSALVGGVIGVGIGIASWMLMIAPILAESAEMFDQLPSVARPLSVELTPRDIASHDNTTRTVLQYGLLLMIAMVGLVNCVVVRPKTRAGAIAAGLISGLTVTLIIFPFSTGWVTTYKQTIEPNENDIYLLARAAFETRDAKHEAARDALVNRYPDLLEMYNSRRSDLLYQKVRAEQIGRIPDGLLTGLLAVMMVGLCPCFLGTIYAHRVLHRNQNKWLAVLAYTEAACTISLLALYTMHLTVGVRAGLVGTIPPAWLWVPLLSALFIASLAAIRNWRWLFRLPLHAAWIALLIAIAQQPTPQCLVAVDALVKQEEYTAAITKLQNHLTKDPSGLNERIVLCTLLAYQGNHQAWNEQVLEMRRLHGHVLHTDVLRWQGMLGLLLPDEDLKFYSVKCAKWASLDRYTDAEVMAWSKLTFALAAIRNSNFELANSRLDQIEWPAKSASYVYGNACEKTLRLLALPETVLPEGRALFREDLDSWMTEHATAFEPRGNPFWHLLIITRTLQKNLPQNETDKRQGVK